MNVPKVVAIVPAYNEEMTIRPVVEALRQSPYLSDVVVVCDGSTDRTVELAREAGARVLVISQQGGKGEALLYALRHTDAPIVAFFDADLRGLTPRHVEQLVLPVLHGSRVMNIGLRDRGRIWTALTRHLPLIAGERVLQREIIEHIPPSFLKGFMVEAALNYACRSRGLPYGAVKLTGLSMRRKYEKVGWGRAVIQYIRMFYQVGKALAVVRIAHVRRKF